MHRGKRPANLDAFIQTFTDLYFIEALLSLATTSQTCIQKFSNSKAYAISYLGIQSIVYRFEQHIPRKVSVILRSCGVYG
jgi:hypothetical protein